VLYSDFYATRFLERRQRALRQICTKKDGLVFE
jgi:hypothetical protein